MKEKKYLFMIHGCVLGLVTLHLEMMNFFLDSDVIQPTLNSTEVFNGVLKIGRSLNLWTPIVGPGPPWKRLPVKKKMRCQTMLSG